MILDTLYPDSGLTLSLDLGHTLSSEPGLKPIPDPVSTLSPYSVFSGSYRV
jgi:hypothetical protein